MATLEELTDEINLIVPIAGLCPSLGRIDYIGNPTRTQQDQAQAMMAVWLLQTPDERRVSTKEQAARDILSRLDPAELKTRNDGTELDEIADALGALKTLLGR